MSTEEPLVSDVAPELHHYTTVDGLKGIIKSQQLRATRFDKLNDGTELRHFRHYLVSYLTKIISRITQPRVQRDATLRSKVDLAGGINVVAENDATYLVNRFCKYTFEGESDTPAFAVPFISSFCCHTADDPYTRQHGLLSQWRAYGADTGRFALVFETSKLEQLLHEEVTANSYSFLNFCDVLYENDDIAFERQFKALVDYLERDWAKHILGEGDGAPEEIFEEFIKCAARFKHRAFHEEREYRIIACPMSQEADRFFRDRGAPPTKELPFKQIETDQRGRSFITLFAGNDARLPISRIIVGPHSEQADLVSKVKTIAGTSIPVYASNTPYLG